MREQVTEAAARVIILAREEAQLLRHNYTGTEHILLGLLRESDGVAATALGSLGVTLEVMREEVRTAVGEGQLQSSAQTPFTPRAGEALALALREARHYGQDRADTEHILLGITRLGRGNAAEVLTTRLGVAMHDIREEINRELGR